MASGSGDTFGAALLAAIAQEAVVLRSYRAVGWHAQISKLTSSPRGYQAAAAAGLSVNRRTLTDWLTERREPSKENRAKIAQAYGLMARQWPVHIERKEIQIHGEVSIGSDVRNRGANGTAPLVVDGSEGSWLRIRQAWEGGAPDPDEIEEWFVEDVLEADLGEGTEPWEFTGTAYTVVIG